MHHILPKRKTIWLKSLDSIIERGLTQIFQYCVLFPVPLWVEFLFIALLQVISSICTMLDTFSTSAEKGSANSWKFVTVFLGVCKSFFRFPLKVLNSSQIFFQDEMLSAIQRLFFWADEGNFSFRTFSTGLMFMRNTKSVIYSEISCLPSSALNLKSSPTQF